MAGLRWYRNVFLRRFHNVVVMLVILLSVFTLCWLPFQIAIIYAEYRPNKHEPFPGWFNKFSFFAHFIAFCNSAFNPIIYTGFNDNFKRGFRNLLGCSQDQFDHSVYGGQNVHVLRAAEVGGGSGSGQLELRRSASTRSFTFSTKI